jgi:hypothetical protein
MRRSGKKYTSKTTPASRLRVSGFISRHTPPFAPSVPPDRGGNKADQGKPPQRTGTGLPALVLCTGNSHQNLCNPFEIKVKFLEEKYSADPEKR